MKKFLFGAVAALGLATSALAEGATPTYSIDTTAITTALPQVQTQLSTYISAVLPYLVAIAAVFMGLWLARLVIRGIKSFGSSAS